MMAVANSVKTAILFMYRHQPAKLFYGVSRVWVLASLGRITRLSVVIGLNAVMVLTGRKVDKSNLPSHIRLWVEKMERLYNRAITLNTSSAWDEWYKA